VKAVSDDQLEAIHEASLTVLQEIGMDFLHAEARAMLKDAGAEVDEASERVRFPRDLIESVIGLRRRSFGCTRAIPTGASNSVGTPGGLRLGGEHAQRC
jgi:trimethylamine:corrinoid methyltransferase-like protein